MKYVTHFGNRWTVLQEEIDPEDGKMLQIMRKVGRIGAERRTSIIWARESECSPWKKGSVRRIISETTERGKKVIFEHDGETGVVTLRLARQRTSLTTTLGGLYWLLVRQQAANVKRDRAFARRTKGARR